MKSKNVITAFAEMAMGPGWSNTPIWYLFNKDGVVYTDCIQPREQTLEMLTLYSVSQAAHIAMTKAVKDYLVKKEGE